MQGFLAATDSCALSPGAAGEAPLDRPRLAKLLGMLGSDHAGERANAGAAADAMVRAAELTWFDVIALSAADLSPSLPDRCRCHQCRAEECLEQPWRLSDWERGFCRSLMRWQREPTAKQTACLDRLCARLGIGP